MADTARLDDWSVNAKPHYPPGTIYLSGRVSGHPSDCHHDGKRVDTSRVATVDGRTIMTSSGTVYRLGRVSAKYRRWLRAHGIPYDPKCPIVLRGDDEGLQWAYSA